MHKPCSIPHLSTHTEMIYFKKNFNFRSHYMIDMNVCGAINEILHASMRWEWSYEIFLNFAHKPLRFYVRSHLVIYASMCVEYYHAQKSHRLIA